MAVKRKKKIMGLKKYYITSQLFDSSEIWEEVKEFCDRERATYRRGMPTETLGPDDLVGAQEKTTRQIPLINFGEGGDISVVPTDFTFFDVNSWRYYFQPETLEDLEEFINFTKLSAALTPYNPETAEDPEESWAESQIGMPLPEGKFVILELADQFLEENDEPSEDEDEEDGEES